MITTQWLSRPMSYEQIWTAMRDFTEARDDTTADQIWLVEHEPVYTLGQAGKVEHILNNAGIPVVSCDRGGQVTYHGPGQVTAYCLIDLRRYHLFVKEYVTLLESVLQDLLHDQGLSGACTRDGAPGVYVPVQSILQDQGGGLLLPTPSDRNADLAHVGPRNPVNVHADNSSLADPFSGLAKIAALGIKVRKGCTYHGLALNVDMDLTPFSGINPCGYHGMPTTDLRSCGVPLTVRETGDLLADRLAAAIIEYGQRKQESSNHDHRQSATAH